MNSILIVAIGNRLRGDDGVAHCFAENFIGKPNVVVIMKQQLLPEIVEEIIRFETVLIVDACVGSSHAKIIKMNCESSCPSFSHFGSSQWLFGLCRLVYGVKPNIYLLSIPAKEFEVPEQLGGYCREKLQEAYDLFSEWIKELPTTSQQILGSNSPEGL